MGDDESDAKRAAGDVDESAKKRADAKVERPESRERRGALGLLVGAGSVAYAAAIAVPGFQYLNGTVAAAKGSAEGTSQDAQWKRVAKLEQLPDGKPARVTIVGETQDAFTVTRGQTLGSVWLQRQGDAVLALSAECPHLGCAIDVGGDRASFGCPCHTSKFSLDGKAESGPSPRAMDELTSRVVDGWVEVDFRRFRQGVAERVEVG